MDEICPRCQNFRRWVKIPEGRKICGSCYVVLKDAVIAYIKTNLWENRIYSLPPGEYGPGTRNEVQERLS